jgi:hypothetical protein
MYISAGFGVYIYSAVFQVSMHVMDQTSQTYEYREAKRIKNGYRMPVAPHYLNFLVASRCQLLDSFQ